MNKPQTDLHRYLQTDVLDILFKDRNKSYGAYELRMNYHRRARKALAIAVTGLFVAVSVPLLATLQDSGTVINPPVVQVHTFDLPDDPVHPADPPPSHPPQAQDPHVNTVQHTIPIIEPAENVTPDDELPDNEQLKNAVSGANDHEGEKPGENPIVPPVTGPEGPATKPEIPEIIETTVESTVVDQLPEFPGGEDELIRYLSEHIQYPERAREQGAQGKVVVGFVVNKDGLIDELKLKRGIGFGCDDEAMRVIRSMPKWKPAKMNGRPVSVYFDLPIQFELEER